MVLSGQAELLLLTVAYSTSRDQSLPCYLWGMEPGHRPVHCPALPHQQGSWEPESGEVCAYTCMPIALMAGQDSTDAHDQVPYPTSQLWTWLTDAGSGQCGGEGGRVDGLGHATAPGRLILPLLAAAVVWLQRAHVHTGTCTHVCVHGPQHLTKTH